MNKFKQLFESEININETDAFMKDVDKVLNKLGYKKSKNSNKYFAYYFDSTDTDITVINDEYIRSVSIGYSAPAKIKELDKALKPLLKKYKGSFNTLSGETWDFVVNVGNIVDEI